MAAAGVAAQPVRDRRGHRRRRERRGRPDEPRPGPRHRQGHGPDAAPLLRAEGHRHVPGGARATSRTSSAAGSSCSTTSGARSSARPASSAPRPARSSASTWAASTRAAASTSTGAPPETYGERREESALRRSGRTVPDPAYRPFAAVDLARSTASSKTTTTTRRTCSQILEATQAAYGYLPVAALKRISQRTGAWYAMIYGTATYYSHLRFEPADGDGPGRGGRRPPAVRGDATSAALDAALAGAGDVAPASRRGRSAMIRPAQDAGRLADDPPRTGRRGRPDRPRRGRPGRRLRRPPRGDPRPRRDRDDRRRSPRPGCAAAAVPASRPPTSGGRPRATEAPRRYVVVNGYGADPATGTDRSCSSATRSRSSRARRSPRSRSARREVIIAVRAEATEAIRAARGGHRRGRGGRLHRLRRPRLGPRHRRSRSGRSRAPTCSARRPSCSRPSRASAASPSSARRIPPSAACSTCRRVVHNVQTLAAVPWIIRHGADGVRRDRRRPTARARSSSRSARRPATASPRSRSGRRCATSSGSAGKLPRRPLDQGDPRRRPVRRPAAARPARHAVRVRAAARRRRPRRLGLGRRRRRPGLHRRPRPPADPLLRRARRAARRSRAGSGPAGWSRSPIASSTAGRGRPIRPCSTDLSADIVASALCDHERLTTLPLASGMRYFRSELDEHILRSACPAGVCHPIAVAAGASA